MKAIIVGATSGIGQEVAKLLASKGWQIGIAGRREEKLLALQSRNLNIIATQCIDVTKDDSAERLRTLIGKMGGIDLYFHSSGIGWQNVELEEEKEIATTITNSVGFTRMVSAAFNYFAEQGKGHIAVISSIGGTKGLGAAPSYSATKRFQNTYIEALSQLANIRNLNITLTDIRPGFVATALIDDNKYYPLKMQATDVAKSIVRGIEKKKAIVTIDWRYRILVFFWKLIPRWLWTRMKIRS